MSNTGPVEVIHTKIWREEPEPDSSFSVRAAYCHGYDVFGDMLGQARWVELLYLLFRGEAPSTQQAALLDALAVSLANPGPRDPSVHAAMCAGVCGSTAASSLMAALAVGAGGLSGGRDVLRAVELWAQCGTDLNTWTHRLMTKDEKQISIWPDSEHIAGFDPHATGAAMVVIQMLDKLAHLSPGQHLRWLSSNRAALEKAAGAPLAVSGVAAAAYYDLEFSSEQAEMLHLMLRLPGAAAHALEQRGYGFRKFPFYSVELEDAPEKEQA